MNTMTGTTPDMRVKSHSELKPHVPQLLVRPSLADWCLARYGREKLVEVPTYELREEDWKHA